jgi:hypothetical protein
VKFTGDGGHQDAVFLLRRMERAALSSLASLSRSKPWRRSTGAVQRFRRRSVRRPESTALQHGQQPLEGACVELGRDAQLGDRTELEVDGGGLGSPGPRPHLDEIGGCGPGNRLRRRRVARGLGEEVLLMAQRPRVDAHLGGELLGAQPAVIPALDPLLPLRTTGAPSRFHAVVVADASSRRHERG